LATCNLNQWALDFEGNCKRIQKSCEIAKSRGATYRLGPELEICGYGCEDHFLEHDTFVHCWESLAKLIELGCTDDLLCDFGMPVLHKSARYNCRVLVYNRKILLIRPKTALADSGNYRESRWFTAYRRPPFSATNNSSSCVSHLLPPDLFPDQREAPFGSQFIQFGDGVTLGCESCEELWTPQASHIEMALNGVDIITNGSGSHHELRKLQSRLELILGATRKCGGVYLYANQRGCDGGRMYFDGSAMIVCNGNILGQGVQFGLDDVEVITACIDLEDVRSYRASIPSLGIQAANATQDAPMPYLTLPQVKMAHADFFSVITQPRELRLHTPEEECCLGPACWLWDFLRRSGASGFFLPLSGGADSSAVAAIVHTMCTLVYHQIKLHGPTSQVAQDLQRLTHTQGTGFMPSSPQEVASHVFTTCFMGSSNSSTSTNSRSFRLAAAIGSYHLRVNIDLMVSAVLKTFAIATGKIPNYESKGGTRGEDLALQNIQARLRMVTAYLFAQLLPWVRGRSGFLLVLGSANVDEALRGYFTKYDASSADLNPIGGINKGDLKRMLLYCADKFDIAVLDEVANAEPTAELRPFDSNENDENDYHTQTDEEDMGMTYAELSYYGRLRKIGRCGPVTMFKKLIQIWQHLTPEEVAAKVKKFFAMYSMNRHKMCTITPAYHAEAYSPDDNRFDLRQFLYNVRWTWQFRRIDELVKNAQAYVGGGVGGDSAADSIGPPSSNGGDHTKVE